MNQGNWKSKRKRPGEVYTYTRPEFRVKSVIPTVAPTRPVDSRLRGNDDIQGTRPRHRHSRESGNPLPVCEP